MMETLFGNDQEQSNNWMNIVRFNKSSGLKKKLFNNASSRKSKLLGHKCSQRLKETCEKLLGRVKNFFWDDCFPYSFNFANGGVFRHNQSQNVYLRLNIIDKGFLAVFQVVVIWTFF